MRTPCDRARWSDMSDAHVTTSEADSVAEPQPSGFVALPPPAVEQVATCPSCGEPAVPNTEFCEGCGSALGAAPSSATTAAPSGTDRPGAPDDMRAHVERVEATFAAVTDRGRIHYRNEDAMAFATHASGALVLVVCDGVSSTQVPELASQAAADAALASLLTALDLQRDLTVALHESVGAAQMAAAVVPWERDRQPGAPSCTFVAAIVRDQTVTVAWVGDSRAYLIEGNGGIRLTTDHSWASQAMAGGMTEDEAMSDPRAHSITNWLGWDHDNQPVADVAEFALPDSSRILLCSDGLWNYASTPGELASLINRADSNETLSVTKSLVAYANQSGGHDNITVVLTDVLTAASLLETPHPE
jgi:PPM family protein phosphatase